MRNVGAVAKTSNAKGAKFNAEFRREGRGASGSRFLPFDYARGRNGRRGRAKAGPSPMAQDDKVKCWVGGWLFLPEAGPALGDEDAVAGVARVVADLGGLVDAEAEDEVGEERDVLRAVVGDAGEAVGVVEDVWGGRGAVFAVEGAGVGDDAVGDAAGGGEALAAAALHFFRRRAAEVEDKADEDGQQKKQDDNAADDARVACLQEVEQMVQKRHGVRRIAGEAGNRK